VAAEVMASVVLLVSAGLLLRALARLESTDPGFRTEGTLTLQTALPEGKYASTSRREQFYTQVLARVRAIPGVQGAGYVTALPMTGGAGIFPVAIAGQPVNRNAANTANVRFVTPGYFSSIGIAIRRGRDVEETDAMDKPLAAVVSESFARRYWPGDDPLGKRFTFALGERTVVGVAGDVRVRGFEQTSEPQVYLPYKQVMGGKLPASLVELRAKFIGYYSPKDLAIRTAVAPASLLPLVRRIVREADPQQPISNVRTMAEIVADQTASRAVQVRVLGAFALIAFLLAAVGIHGLLGFTVSQRSQEFGLRMALGARQGAIVGMVMRQALVLALGGIIPGIALAYAAGRGMEALLAGVKPGDAASFLAAALLCLLMTLAGSLLPVLRAVRVPPSTVFRGE
jgi:putative ABC transport system permease protein